MIRKYRKGIKLLLLMLLLSGCNSQDGKESADGKAAGHVEMRQEAPVKPKSPLNALESLVAPIALYPDPLLAEMLIAATYPLEIAKIAQRGDNVANSSLDASLRRLAQLPQVIMMMDEHAQWVSALGDAFLANPEALLQSIQTLRHRAWQSGFLKDSSAQKVRQPAAAPDANMQDAISIQPAEAETIQLPLYDPETAFSATLAAPPTKGNNSLEAQPFEDGGADTGYYPAYYPATAEAGDNGVAPQAFSASVTIKGLVTWGVIAWQTVENGYRIKHRYGNLTICHNFEDCWLRSKDNGYQYLDELIAAAEQDAGRGIKFWGISWQHDPRHRRGVLYTQETVKRLGYLAPPPLAGQQLNANLPPPADRGYQTIDSAPVPDDAEEEDFAVAAPAFRDEGDSVLSGLVDFKSGENVAIMSGAESRHKDQVSAPSSGTVLPSAAQRPVTQAVVAQNAVWHELQVQQQRREAAFSGVFAALSGNVRLIELFSARGAQSRGSQLQAQAGDPAGGRAKQARQQSD
jgi:hypothetical protein